MHWTTLSDYEIFADSVALDQMSNHVQQEEITVGDALLIVERDANGHAIIHRLVSPRASDYLRPEWQPGMMVQM